MSRKEILPNFQAKLRNKNQGYNLKQSEFWIDYVSNI